MAAALRTHQQAISKIETGDRALGVLEAHDLARLYGVDLAGLLAEACRKPGEFEVGEPGDRSADLQ